MSRLDEELEALKAIYEVRRKVYLVIRLATSTDCEVRASYQYNLHTTPMFAAVYC